MRRLEVRMQFAPFARDPVLFCHYLGLSQWGDRFSGWPPAGFAYGNAALNRPLTDSTNGFSQGQAWWNGLGAQSIASAPLLQGMGNALSPLSIRRWVGAGYRPRGSPMAVIPSTALQLLPTQMASVRRG